jgi:sulfur carrier protein ThiS
MKITAKFLGKEKVLVVGEGANVLEVLRKMEINPETVLVKRGKEIITEDEPLAGRDEIEIIKVVSGG